MKACFHINNHYKQLKMDDFENIGVFLQLGAMIILLLNILFTQNCTGISGRTQVLHALVFTTRFLDLPDEFRISLLSFILKIVYLFVAYMTVASIFLICRRSYERENDTFRIDLMIGACATLALISSYKNLDILSVLWYFSVFLETFSILPQILFTFKAKYAGSSLVFYVGLLSCYRGFFVVHWAYTYLTANYLDNYFVVVGGTVQFVIYCGYFAWMMPMFKYQYAHLNNVDASLHIAKGLDGRINNSTENGNAMKV